ncbi:MAG TPA: sigma-70 family RNA polymerase sigma factor [Candidatus Eisenbacteria bacterium]|nr:sigma-70 family RNA polymerase sigma factor [Candidatus Eisenbacteria bacterium]
MDSLPAASSTDVRPSAAVREFAAQQYARSEAGQYGMDIGELTAIVAEIVKQRVWGGDEAAEQDFLAALRLEELVLARACAKGNERAWEVFLTRYRNTLYETAYKIARTESDARGLADSLYAELYGVDAKGQQRTSKLRYYQGRGSLQGWLRTVVAQEYINHYRSTKKETSLDAALDDGAQFAAAEPEPVVAEPRVDAAVKAELTALDADERFLLAAYYLDHRTLAEIAKLQGVHESTISRKLERTVTAVRKRMVKRLVQSGMSGREAEEALQSTDVRDLHVKVNETLRQGMPKTTFYKEKGETQG